MLSKLSILFTACLILTTGPSEGSPPSDQMINIGSHRLQISIEGEGSPTVVIETGIGDASDKWKPLQERMARLTRVVTYNRAGYGQSEPGPLPRNIGREAEELKALLEKASVPGPYVIVGHSYGAEIVQIFASRYPDDVLGMVLLDPPPFSFIQGQDYKDMRDTAEKMTAEWQGIADSAAKSDDPGEKAQSVFFRMIASEHREMFGESAKLVGAVSSFGDMPLVVLAAGKPNPAFGEVAGEFQQYWIEQSRALTNKSSNSRFILAEKSSHLLYLDVPDLVAESILSLVRDVRAK